MAFCDYCDCEECREGTPYLQHAHVSDACGGGWICEVCFNYSVCLAAPARRGKGPCEDRNCVHRPEIAGPWIQGNRPN